MSGGSVLLLGNSLSRRVSNVYVFVDRYSSDYSQQCAILMVYRTLWVIVLSWTSQGCMFRGGHSVPADASSGHSKALREARRYALLSGGLESSPAFANNSEIWELVNGLSGDGTLITLVLEIRLALEKGIDPFDDAFDICLAADAANSGLSRLFGKLGRRVHGDHQDGRVRGAHCYLSGGFQPVHHGHLEIEYDNIEFLAAELRDSFLAVRGLIAHFPVILSLQ